MFHKSDDPVKVIIDELTKQGMTLSSEDLERIQACFDELRRSVPPGKFRDVAKAVAQVVVERLRGYVPSGFGGFLSIISSCRLIGYQLRRRESIYCPIIVPAGFTAVSTISVSSSPGNVFFFIKRIGEPINRNAYYAEDVILVGYFDINRVSWCQRLNPGLYLVEVHNYYNESVVVSIDVMTCIINGDH